MQFIVVMCLTALTALAAHLGKAVFHDGIRPILPEVIEARMNRRELASIASGLSFGFIVSVGISFAFSFQMLNPWLLFLPTDILGILATRWWIALVLGAAWGAIALFGLAGVLSLATMLPIDIIDPLSQLNVGFLVAVAVFPLVAIMNQFGWKRALSSAVIVLVTRQSLALYTDSGIFIQVAMTTIVSVLLLVGFVLHKAWTQRRDLDVDEQEEELEQRIHLKRIVKGLPLFMAIGGCVAIATNLGLFTGSDATIPYLQNAWSAGEATTRGGWLQSAAVIDIIRLLSFMPLIVTTALATGVYGVMGLMFVLPIGYLSPNPVVAGLLGAVVVCLEIAAISKISTCLQRYPMIRETSDYFRSAMNTMIEIGLLIGGALAVFQMESSTAGLGLMLYILLYAANEGLGRPVMRLAFGPVAAIVVGLALNILYFTHLL
ncbi:YhfT family protein [Paenibacillus etheri]|nr:YhfT family protein [Paenibacillus etheri]